MKTPTPRPAPPAPLRDDRPTDPLGFVILMIMILAIVVFACLWVGILQGCTPGGVAPSATATAPAPTPNWTGEPVENWLRQAAW